MKYRKGFVTNSSSSSFVIAYKDISTICEIEKQDYLYLQKINKLLEDKLISEEKDSWYDTYEGSVVNTVSELKTYFITHFIGNGVILEEFFNENPNRKKDFDTMVQYINSGYKIIFKDVDNCDNNMHNFIQYMSDNKNFIILDEY